MLLTKMEVESDVSLIELREGQCFCDSYETAYCVVVFKNDLEAAAKDAAASFYGAIALQSGETYAARMLSAQTVAVKAWGGEERNYELTKKAGSDEFQIVYRSHEQLH